MKRSEFEEYLRIRAGCLHRFLQWLELAHKWRDKHELNNRQLASLLQEITPHELRGWQEIHDFTTLLACNESLPGWDMDKFMFGKEQNFVTNKLEETL